MNRQQKESVVELLKEQFVQSPAAFIVDYKGLTVAQMQDLRSELRKSGGMFKVAKARLLKRAVGDLETTRELMPYFKEQIGVVFASDEPPAIAKVLNNFAKESKTLKLVIGQLDGELLDQPSIGRIAMLPSKDVLRAKLCGTLNAPVTRLVFALNMQLMQLFLVLKLMTEKKK